MPPVVRALVCAVLTGVSVPAVRGAAPAQNPGVHEQALALYETGDVEGAIAKLSALTDDEIRDAINEISRRQGPHPASRSLAVRRVILLHTEKWFASEAATQSRIYFDSARSLVKMLERAAEPRDAAVKTAERTFVRDWYLLLVAFFHQGAHVGRSRLYLDEARRMFPRDARVLLALGADAEMLSGLAVGYVQRFDTAGNLVGEEVIDGEQERREAWRFLREAVAEEPDLLEARLRLGRVMYRRGDLDGAARELEIVARRVPDDMLKYLASVFLAMVETRRGRFDRAAELYETARQLFPTAQTAVIGRSELAYVRGRPAEAAALIAPLLGRVERDDPWWAYVMGEAWHLPARLAGLRAGVQR